MLFDCSDIDLLRLTGFLKNLPLGQEGWYSLRLLTPAVISPLQEYGYLGLTRNGLSYNLKPAGYDLLCFLGFDYPQDKRQPSHLPELHRRFDGASVFLSFYRAGMEVFSPQLSGLRKPLSYVHGSVIRRDSCMSNTRLFGGCRFSGIGRIRDTAYAVHFIDKGRHRAAAAAKRHPPLRLPRRADLRPEQLPGDRPAPGRGAAGGKSPQRFRHLPGGV